MGLLSETAKAGHEEEHKQHPDHSRSDNSDRLLDVRTDIRRDGIQFVGGRIVSEDMPRHGEGLQLIELPCLIPGHWVFTDDKPVALDAVRILRDEC